MHDPNNTQISNNHQDNNNEHLNNNNHQVNEGNEGKKGKKSCNGRLLGELQRAVKVEIARTASCTYPFFSLIFTLIKF